MLIRVNQVGFLPTDYKHAILMATFSQQGQKYEVIDVNSGIVVYGGRVGDSLGAWNSKYSNTYLLNFTSVRAIGSYYIRMAHYPSVVSPTFRICSAEGLYESLLPDALFFYQAQQDGPRVNNSVLDRQPSHLLDRNATVYNIPAYNVDDSLQGQLIPTGGPVNVAGGWFDAGDYIKLVETASYTDAMMLFAVKSYSSLLGAPPADFRKEAKFGLDWLQKMWNESSRTLYYQVGIGDGNGNTILGDHDIWRLPQVDDTLNVAVNPQLYYVKYRPVFEAGPSGSPISPNLAGRLSADFALCYQVFYQSDPAFANRCLANAETVFDLAKTTQVGQLLTASPHDYYPEVEWRDDMELGATELYFAVSLASSSTSLPHGLLQTNPLYYLRQAAHWAHAYMTGPYDGKDSLNLYDVSGLAHYELYLAITQADGPRGLEVTKGELLNDLDLQLMNGVNQSMHDSFGLGVAYNSGVDLTPHALGYVMEAEFYDALAHTARFSDFGTTERDWVLGDNAWGSSFVVGVGETFPDCLQHQVANLVGSLNGKPPLLYGAVVDGPNALSTFQGLGSVQGMNRCPTSGGDPNAQFTGNGARYWDNVKAWPSTEPADDYTSLSILVYASQAAL